MLNIVNCASCALKRKERNKTRRKTGECYERSTLFREPRAPAAARRAARRAKEKTKLGMVKPVNWDPWPRCRSWVCLLSGVLARQCGGGGDAESMTLQQRRTTKRSILASHRIR